MPFMSLRVATTGNELQELNERMVDLIAKIEGVHRQCESEDLDNESLKHTKKTMLK